MMKIRKRLEDLSSAYKQMCEMGINSPESCITGIHRHNAFAIAVEASYKIFCEESNIPYEQLNQPRLEWEGKK